MKSVKANFVPVRQPPRWTWWTVVAGVAASLGLAAWTAWNLVAADRLKREHETVARLRVASVRPPSPPEVRYPAYYDSAVQMVAQRRYVWPEALAALESVVDSGVAVESFELDPSDGSVRVAVSLGPQANLIEYLDALNAGNTGAPGEPVWRLIELRKGGDLGFTATVKVSRNAGGTSNGMPQTVTGEPLGPVRQQR